MGSVWKRIPENLSADEFMLAFAQQFNQWAADKDRFESSVTTPTSKRSSGSSIALTREQTVDISRVGMLVGVTGSVADLPFITVTNTASLNAERALAVADPLNKDDNGANSTLVLGVSYATPSFTFSTANAAGSNARPVRSDATLAIFDTASPEGISTGLSAGSAAFSARRDHVHNITGVDVATVSKLTGASNSTTLTLFDPDGVSQSLVSSVGDVLLTTAGLTGGYDFKKAIRVSGTTTAFGSASNIGAIFIDGGGAILGSRIDPANAPFFTFSPLDDGSTERTLYFGGGGWDTPDATHIEFWTAPAYTETTNTGVKRAEINPVDAQHADNTNSMAFHSGCNIIPNTDAVMSLGTKGPPASRNRRFAFICGMTALIDGTFSHSGNSYGVFSVTPVARQSQTTDIKDALTNYGWLQGTTMSPLNLDGGTFTAGDIVSDGSANVGSLFLKDNLSSNYLRFQVANGTTLTANRILAVDLDNDTRRMVVTNNAMGVATGEIAAWAPGDSGSNMMRIIGSDVTIDPTTSALTFATTNGSSAQYNMPQVAAPASPMDGDFWHDSTQNTEVGFLSGIKNHRHGGLYVSTADATADATTEETLIGSGVGTVTLPANFYVAGKSLFFENQGYANHGISNEVGHFALKIGGTTISGMTFNAPSIQADNPYIFRQMLTCRSVAGSSALLIGQHWLDYLGGATATARTAGVTVAVTALGISFTGYWDSITDTPSVTSTNCYISTGF